MEVLERVMELESQGVSDTDIIKKLRDDGISPGDISEALSQAKIKSAVSQPGISEQENPEMQQSIMDPQEETQYSAPEQQAQPQYQQAQQYQPYPQDQSYYPPQQSDSETISEIAEQVVSEKFRTFEQKTGDIVSFKNSMQDKISDLNERLKRIELSLDKIQQAIIGKVGEFGENISYVHKDLDNLHNTVSKLMNPLIDNYQALKKISGKPDAPQRQSPQ